MFAELRKHPRALVLSLLLHAAIIAMMVLNLTFSDRPQQIKAGQQSTVQAEVIDLKQLEAREQQKQAEAKRKAASLLHVPYRRRTLDDQKGSENLEDGILRI